MQSPVWKTGVPRAILLATDLSSRCDRAFDRAVALARQWSAKLVVLTVIEPDAGPAPTDVITRAKAQPDVVDPHLRAALQVHSDIAFAASDVQVEVLVREGGAINPPTGRRIEATAAERGCSLIVTGTARDEPFGRILIGSTVQWLARTSKIPVLIVHRRVHGPYRRIVVASDFSPSSRRALDTLGALFPDAHPTLFHAFDVPFLGLIDANRDSTVEQVRAAALAEAREFLANAGRPMLPLRVEHGDPAITLRDHARNNDTELVVVASHGRSALYNLMIGSVAQQILDLVPCDTLLVPEPRARNSQ